MPWTTLGVVLLAALVFAVSQGVVAPAIGTIATTFHTSPATAAWTLTGFLLAASVATPVLGKLGDIYSKRDLLVITLVIMSAGSVVSALAGSVWLLIDGRVVQGVSGGVFPLAFGIVRDTFPRERVPMGISLVSAVFGIGAAAGLPLSGVLLAHAGLSWLFWVGLAGLPAAAVAIAVIPATAPTGPAQRRMDWAGVGLLSAGLVAVLLPISQAGSWGWGSAPVIGLLVASVAVFAIWAVVERRVAGPLVDMDVFVRRPVLLTNVASLIIGFALFAAMLLVPQFLETPERAGYGFGASVTAAGLVLVPIGAAMLVLGPVAGWLGPRVGYRPLFGGGALAVAAGFVWIAAAHAHEWDFVGGLSLLGIGYAFAFASMSNLIVDAVDRADVGVATGVNTITRTVGGAFGSAIGAAILAANTIPGTPIPHASAYTTAFLIAAVAAIVAALVTLGLPRHRDDIAVAAGGPEPTTRQVTLRS